MTKLAIFDFDTLRDYNEYIAILKKCVNKKMEVWIVGVGDAITVSNFLTKCGVINGVKIISIDGKLKHTYLKNKLSKGNFEIVYLFDKSPGCGRLLIDMRHISNLHIETDYGQL